MVQSLPDNISYKAGNAGGNMWKNILWAPIVLIILFLFVPDEMTLLVQGLVLIGLATGIGGGIFWVLGWREKQQILRVEKQALMLKARVVETKDGTWVESAPNLELIPLHQNPYLRINGHHRDLNQDERDFMYLTRVIDKSKSTQPAFPQLVSGKEEIIEEEKLDLIKVFTQPTQSYAIIGGQQTGKTFQAQHIANYWLDRNIKPVVIGPKWDKGEWAGCFLMGGDGDYQRVEAGIRKVMALADKRHADKSSGHKERPIQPIFFDDWTPVVQNTENAESLITNATVMYASVNIILYFIIHADTANAWGVGKIGAALKNNFIKLRIVPTYDHDGMIIRNQTKGYIRFAGEDIDRPAKLLNRPLEQRGKSVQIITQPKPPVETKKVDTKKQKIIDMIRQGKSNNDIAKEVYNKPTLGGTQYYEVLEFRNKMKQNLLLP